MKHFTTLLFLLLIISFTTAEDVWFDLTPPRQDSPSKFNFTTTNEEIITFYQEYDIQVKEVKKTDRVVCKSLACPPPWTLFILIGEEDKEKVQHIQDSIIAEILHDRK